MAGFARSSRGQPDLQVELFHYSEQEKLDTKVLEAQVSSSGASEASVLLLATAASSYLWFDAEHCPRNVELCAILRRFPELRVNFIVCPTTESARVAWQQHQPDLESVFGEFLPETGKVDLWTHFDPDVELESQQICSLVCRSRNPSCSKPEAVHQQQSGLVWKAVPPVNVLVAVLLLVALLVLVAFKWQLRAKSTGLHATLKLGSTCESQVKDISELQSHVAALDEKIVRIQTNHKSHEKSGELDTSCELHANSISELSGVSQAKETVNDLRNQTASLDKKVEAVRASAKVHEQKIGHLSSCMESHNETSESHGKVISKLESEADSKAKLVDHLSTRIALLEQKIDQILELCADAAASAKNLRDELESRAAGLDERIGQIQTKQELHSKKLGELETSSGSHVDNIHQIQAFQGSQGSELTTQITELGFRPPSRHELSIEPHTCARQTKNDGASRAVDLQCAMESLVGPDPANKA